MTSSTINLKRVELIKEKLTQAFQPTELTITDDSHLHAGHAGAKSGKGHFTVIIKSESFANMRKLKQHQAIYSVLDSLMETDIHALSIQSSE